MSAAQIAAYGRLGGDPRAIETTTGRPMAVASLAVDVADARSTDEQPPQWFGVVAFGAQAEALLKHGRGDLVSVFGRLQRNTYTTSQGEQREQLQLVAESLVSARTARPGGRMRGGSTYRPGPEPTAQWCAEMNTTTRKCGGNAGPPRGRFMLLRNAKVAAEVGRRGLTEIHDVAAITRLTNVDLRRAPRHADSAVHGTGCSVGFALGTHPLRAQCEPQRLVRWAG